MWAHKDKCTGVVANASAWTIGILLDEIEKRKNTLEDFMHLNCSTGKTTVHRKCK